MDELLSVAEMYRADQLAIAAGVPGSALMEAAGAAVVRAVCERWAPHPTAVLCGPGNNGGDGFVIARLLLEAGWPVRLALLGSRSALTGAAAIAAERWPGPIEAADPYILRGNPLVIDALFGAGLSRPLDGLARSIVEAMEGRTVVAVDVPSGLHGDSGRVLGAAPQAALTVTFFRRKPGHVLLPGRSLCGEVVVADIGIPERVLDTIAPQTAVNEPSLWRHRFPWPALDGHKYARGHALVLGGARMTGAARLASVAALRAGAGLVTIACPPEAFPVYAAGCASVIVDPLEDEGAFARLLADPRRNAVLIGPGAGRGAPTRSAVMTVLDGRRTGVSDARRACVLDADALTSFAESADELFDLLDRRCVLTPHEGEFARLFGDSVGMDGDKLSRVRAAAARSGAVVVLKGADTVVAAPDGRAVVNMNAPPDLATAGSGDMLAGIALGLLAQGMDGFEAACTAVWLHGEAGRALGPGLISDDLAGALPGVLKALRTQG
ncbi:carbohydrate kinase [Azospirillum sp. B510]|uniref:bifunctional ADP-dependent NAD(P)H-hydrate dehydratase/NAD(P)H-hydrate epimerase n=1 Tax=Azospirillum sp. (strain B510) TaxID=137722 RepID=UPI0001C4C323|nr:bifunctional ADP-dependent NAD(P)H-hydrate dehydratase/NAD(P)H-hydrate epimerase [Azospirillum sp. B510]BAI72558.1 carbohydrate kinase [Azospirillum sp. B510]